MKFYKECSLEEAIETFDNFINNVSSLFEDTMEYNIASIIEFEGKYDVHIHNDNRDYMLFIPKAIRMCRYLNDVCVFLYLTGDKYCYYIDDFKEYGGLRKIEMEL